MSRVVFFLIDQVTSSFEWQELNNLRANFDKVVLITGERNSDIRAEDHLIMETIDQAAYSTSAYGKKAMAYLPRIIGEFLRSGKHIRHPKLFMIQLSLFMRSMYLADSIATIVKKHAKEGDQVLLYSFWFNHWANAIGFLRGRLKNARLITRAHGTDLYEERVIGLQRIVFRKLYMKQLDFVFSVSEKGTTYLKNKYPSQAHKIMTAYLGTVYFGKNEPDKNAVFTIVSCARIRKIKRLHKLPEILSHVKHPVRWIHIGEEAKNDAYVNVFREQVNVLKERNPKVEIVFKGNLANEEVLELYKITPVDLFVSVSENEGLPVSMMEAISAGIPVLSTDVGGCNEIVTPTTGLLIKKEFDTKEVAGLIDRLIEQGMGPLADRAAIQDYWKVHFENDQNVHSFLNKMGMQQEAVLN